MAVPEAECEVTTVRGGEIVDIVAAEADLEEMVVLG